MILSEKEVLSIRRFLTARYLAIMKQIDNLAIEGPNSTTVQRNLLNEVEELFLLLDKFGVSVPYIDRCYVRNALKRL